MSTIKNFRSVSQNRSIICIKWFKCVQLCSMTHNLQSLLILEESLALELSLLTELNQVNSTPKKEPQSTIHFGSTKTMKSSWKIGDVDPSVVDDGKNSILCCSSEIVTLPTNAVLFCTLSFFVGTPAHPQLATRNSQSAIDQEQCLHCPTPWGSRSKGGGIAKMRPMSRFHKHLPKPTISKFSTTIPTPKSPVDFNRRENCFRVQGITLLMTPPQEVPKPATLSILENPHPEVC